MIAPILPHTALLSCATADRRIAARWLGSERFEHTAGASVRTPRRCRKPRWGRCEVLDGLRELGLRTLVVATKIDKLRSVAELRETLSQLEFALDLAGDLADDLDDELGGGTSGDGLDSATGGQGLLVFSSETAQGRPEVWGAIQQALLDHDASSP